MEDPILAAARHWYEVRRKMYENGPFVTDEQYMELTLAEQALIEAHKAQERYSEDHRSDG